MFNRQHGLTLAVILLMAASSGGYARAASQNPPQHPFMFFNAAERKKLGERKEKDTFLKQAWERIKLRAEREDDPRRWMSQLEARAFLWQVERDERMGAAAVRILKKGVERTEPQRFYRKANFHYQAHPLRALALGWDWLHERLTPEERRAILPKLERWCEVALAHTNKQWWREASYNVGAIPVAGIGLLATSIRADASHPQKERWYREAVRRIGQNFFTLSWKPSGICWEGPNYAIVGLRYASQFAEALHRSGGPDLLRDSGALKSMSYLMYQWLPWGGCAPIGDNTRYGRRTFAAEYLLMMARSRDRAGLWTWKKHTHPERLDPLITYLWFPTGLDPKPPTRLKLPTSKYFEVTRNRAGYVFGRSAWEDPHAAFFSFVTRYEKQNHQHYDMNSFLFGGFGELFASHANIFPYAHEHHGVDFEHNLVIVNGGGWPAFDKSNSCGDDNSTHGFLTGKALGPFADYVRGDAKWSYRDNTFLNSNPAIRAERTCLFVKEGPAPYLLVLDDQQFSNVPAVYEWLWHAPPRPISGRGTNADPLFITGKHGQCAIRVIHPGKFDVTRTPEKRVSPKRRPWQMDCSPPSIEFAPQESSKNPKGAEAGSAQERLALSKVEGPALSKVEGPALSPAEGPALSKAEGPALIRLGVKQKGVRVQYAALASLHPISEDPLETLRMEPLTIDRGPESARGILVHTKDGHKDYILWQAEEGKLQCGSDVLAGTISTDALLALIRIREGRLIGYVLGEGTYLKWRDRKIVRAKSSVCVTRGKRGRQITGRLRTRTGLPEIPPKSVSTASPGMRLE